MNNIDKVVRLYTSSEEFRTLFGMNRQAALAGSNIMLTDQETRTLEEVLAAPLAWLKPTGRC